MAKFGGGCLRDASDFLRVAEIIKQDQAEGVVVVVSAVFGVTDMLYNGARYALNSEASIPQTMRNIRTRHLDIIEAGVHNPVIMVQVKRLIEERLQKLERLLYGVAYIGELTESVRVLVLSQGERLAAVILAHVLQASGIDSEVLETDCIGLLTDNVFDGASANLSRARYNIQRQVTPLITSNATPVITGFFGCNEAGQTTTFGRNGSDYSAAVIACALDARVLDIWKDVNGFMTADPKIIEHAIPIELLSYSEAAELSYFGAKILHPRTVEPLRDSNIEINIRNIRSPDGPRTVIWPRGQAERDVIKSIACNSGISVLKIHGAGVGFKPGIIGEIGKTLSLVNINIFSVITSQTCINLLLDSRDSLMSRDALLPLVGGVIGEIDVRDDLALIAVVGEGLLTTRGLAARVFSAVAESGVNVEMFSAGASDVAYYFIVKREDMEPAIQAVHRSFFESKATT
ncbi:MAG: aspartate kinase [Candidatus Thorarchaeota archaeon]|nr:aspartate kinase [Candidatus Thorarchaeota archaeon]